MISEKIIRGVIIIFVVLIGVSALRAQYFGRNKVQYQDFDFQVLQTPHYKVYHYAGESPAVLDAAYMLERWYHRYSNFFRYDVPGSQPVILYANHADFQQTNVIGGMIPQGTGGVTEGYMNRMVIPLTGIASDDNHVLGHELVHAFQYKLIQASGERLSSSRRLPTWFVEGMAEYLSIGREDPLTAMWMRDAVLHDDVPTIEDVMTERKYFPYRYGHALWGYITGRVGDPIVKPLFLSVLKSGWSQGVENVVGISGDSLSAEWQNAIREKYKSQVENRIPPDSVGSPLITGGGGMNMAPALSPDGEYLVYISQRELFSLDLYLANANTGKVIRKLTTGETNAHFDALRFMDASGAWSPDSKQFAFVVIKKGDNAISIVNVNTGEVKRTIPVKDLDAIQHLAWSPGGDQLLITGSVGGISDLFLYGLKSGHLQKITTGRYAEIQPSWGPAGEHIVFATDRGMETDLDEYVYSDMKLGIMDVNTFEISLVSMGKDIKHINPYYSPDGTSIFFVGDPDGISNVYRYELSSGAFYRVTNIATGVSGLTERSPVLSLAAQTGYLAFSVFSRTEYHIHTLAPDSTTGIRITRTAEERNTRITLPPGKRTDANIVDNFIEEKTTGIPDTTEFQSSDYSPTLRLLRAGQGAIGLSVNQYGTGVAGGVNLVFSDILGNHLLAVTARSSGSLQDIGGQVIYRNRDSRINWGGSIAHIPYRTSQGAASTVVDTTEEGNLIESREINIFTRRTFYDRIDGMTEYPFSKNRRLEWSAGYTRIGYSLEAEIYKVRNGRIIARDTESLESRNPLNIGSTAIAYVGDYSYFGFTGPVKGRRYRFELEPSFGSMQYLTATADYRHYFYASPVTFAFRGLHYGRYLQDAENDRLSPLNLGFKTWVRGYSPESFDYQDCQSGDCPEMNRLTGSKVSVVNAEIRVPVLGSGRLSLIDFRFLPTDFVAFFDGGVAWTQKSMPDFEFAANSEKRIPVFSTGIAARINLFGYLVGQVYYAYPFQRQRTGAHVGFVLSPGW